MRVLRFHSDALRQYNEWAARDIKTFNRIRELLNDIRKNPFKGIGKPEPLRFGYKGYWSRRITQEHRLVYRVEPHSVIIFSCHGHY
ncbi:MAG: Txe/YoeB family addiction module toxin [Bacteroidetes bacterium]|nr:MAG: Txe/YoeB family addiction module toxin [Bacteroidota bacterium]